MNLLRPGEAWVVGVSAVVFAFLAVDVAVGGPVSGLDVWIEHRVGAHRTGLVEAVGGLGGLGVSAAVLAVSAIMTGHLSWRVWPVLIAVGNAGAMAVIVLGVKAVVGRSGPVYVTWSPDYPGFFPSGHTATAGVCLGTAAYLWAAFRRRPHRRISPPAVGIALGLLVGAAVAVASVAGGYHWFSDVVGGLAVVGFVLPLGFAVRRSVGT